MYGAEPGKPSFAATCLLARRLVERGVRFVEIFHEAWDQHGNLVHDIKKNCEDTDQACAALVTDLKQRGLLDDTLVIWGGEFGRTPMVQGGGNDGRDHHPNAFTMWLAGGGIKPGITLGESDELGFNVDEGPRPRPRPARHDPAPAGLRPDAILVQVPGPRPAAHRRGAGARGDGNPGITVNEVIQWQPMTMFWAPHNTCHPRNEFGWSTNFGRRFRQKIGPSRVKRGLTRFSSVRRSTTLVG